MAPVGHKARPEKTALILARRLVEDIRRRRLRAGDRLPSERAMLADYRAGRGTLREALRLLELHKVISLKPGPGGGPTVEKPDAATLATTLTLLLQFDDATYATVVAARRDLEPLFAGLAAEQMTGVELDLIAANVDRMRTSLDDPRRFINAGQEFHSLIARGTHNPFYAFLADAVHRILARADLVSHYPARRSEAVLHAHEAIADTLLSRDAEACSAVMERHMREYLTHMTTTFPETLTHRIAWGLG